MQILGLWSLGRFVLYIQECLPSSLANPCMITGRVLCYSYTLLKVLSERLNVFLMCLWALANNIQLLHV